MNKNINAHAYIGQDIISADQVIGKTLIARTNVPLVRNTQPNAPVVYTAKPGEVVGVVYSWIHNTGPFYWAFYDPNGKAYYAEHKVGRFLVEALQQQGVQTLEDIKEAQEAANNPILSTIQKILKPVALAAAAFFIIRALK